MKLSAVVEDGAEAHAMIESGEVSVNDEAEDRRGRQLHLGDYFEFNGERFVITSDQES